MIQRTTQTASYWEEDFRFTGADVGILYERILDKGRPVSTEDLAVFLIERHCRKEEESIRKRLGDGRLYKPAEPYEIGETLIFPALGMVQGKVVGARPGHNPEYGEFTAIQVQIEDDGDQDVREFASGLEGDHPLNQFSGLDEFLAAGDLLGVPELYAAYGHTVEEKLAAVLAEHKEFVRYREQWFLKELLAPINEGHLNIAEALIEIKGMPIQSAQFLPDLDLPVEIPEAVQLLSINHYLEVDGRFDNIGDSGRDIWYLRRLIPKPVVEPPARLSLIRVPYERSDISPELLAIEQEIDDEGSGEEVWGPGRRIYQTTVGLIYPHWRCGTLPLTVRTRALFPQATRHHTPIVLVDGQTGEKMQGWIVHEASHVYGLESWYRRNKLPVGARIKLERTRDPRVISVDFEPQRLRPMWIKVAKAEAGKLIFQVRKVPLACEYDDQLAIGEDNPNAIDTLWVESRTRGDSLYQIVTRIMPGLIALSPQGTVHAKSIYSAANVLKRVTPGPVFALLSTEPCFVSMGGGYWTFDEALVKPVKG